MKKIMLVLAFVAGIVFFCSGIELSKFYCDKAKKMEKELSSVELKSDCWEYMANMEALIRYEIIVSLSPKIGLEVDALEKNYYNYMVERVALEAKYTNLPASDSQEYKNMLKFQEASAYDAVVHLLFSLPNELDESYRQVCDQAIIEAIKKHPITSKK